MGLRFKVQSQGLRLLSSRFRIRGLGFGVYGLKSRVYRSDAGRLLEVVCLRRTNEAEGLVVLVEDRALQVERARSPMREAEADLAH